MCALNRVLTSGITNGRNVSYEILKGMGYSSRDKVKNLLKIYYFVYVYEIKKRYRKTRQE